MKKLMMLLLTALLCLPFFAFGTEGYAAGRQGWKLDYYPDEFNEPTEEAYLTNTRPFSGTYNTAELSNKPLEANLLVEEGFIWIELIPKGGEAIKFSEEGEYRVSIRAEDGSVFDSFPYVEAGDTRVGLGYYDLSMREEGTVIDLGGGKYFTVEDSEYVSPLFRLLCETESLKIYLEDTAHPEINYLVTVSTDGFAAAYYQLLVEPALAEQYAAAEQLFGEGNYQDALDDFSALGGYKDSRDRAAEALEAKNAADYAAAEALLTDGDYDGAIAAFEALGAYKDSMEQLAEAHYLQALRLAGDGQFEEAITALQALGEYKDSQEKIERLREEQTEAAYVAAVELLDAEKFDEAIAAFTALNGYKDSAEQIKTAHYKHALALEKAGDLFHAATAFFAAGDYQDARERSLALWDGLAVRRNHIAASAYHSVGLKADGTVLALGNNDLAQCDVADWTDIVSVAVGRVHTVGLRSDGTVVGTGYNDDGRYNVEDWTDIIAIAAGDTHTVGLRADGTVISTPVGEDPETDLGQDKVEGWTDIVAIAAGAYHTVGLKADGTVVATGNNQDGECDVEDWTDIVAVAAGAFHTVGLRADGTVVTVGYQEDGQANVKNWTGITFISAGQRNTLGIKKNGTVVATRAENQAGNEVSPWKNIVEVAAGENHSLGLMADGSVVATGYGKYGQLDVEDWVLKVPD